MKENKKRSSTNPCLWMQAGVVESKTCNNFYDCTTCKYDQGMRKQVEKGNQLSWQESDEEKAGSREDLPPYSDSPDRKASLRLQL